MSLDRLVARQALEAKLDQIQQGLDDIDLEMPPGRLCAAYFQGSTAHARVNGIQFWSGAMDKSSWRSNSLQVSTFVSPDNVGWYGTLQDPSPSLPNSNFIIIILMSTVQMMGIIERNLNDSSKGRLNDSSLLLW